MSDSPLLIHIGYPKTASSWLQADIFANHSTGFCVPWVNQQGLCHAASDLFINCDVFSQTAASEFFLPGLEIAAKQQLTPVLSNEFLSGGFFFTPPNYHPSLPGEIATRLHSVFPSAKILIVIREQKAMLISAYRQMLIMGHSLSIAEFINTGDKKITHPTVGNLVNLKFDEIIEKYQEVFTPNNVLVLPLEILIKDKNLFFNNIYNFLQIPAQEIKNEEAKNVGLKGGRLALLRMLNYPISFTRNIPILSSNIFIANYKIAQLLEPFVPQKINEAVETEIKTFVKDAVGDYYRESNQKTSQLIGIDLAKLGYPE